MKPIPQTCDRCGAVLGVCVCVCVCGSGSTLVDAHDTGRRFTGIELEAGHQNTARKRLDARAKEPEAWPLQPHASDHFCYDPPSRRPKPHRTAPHRRLIVPSVVRALRMLGNRVAQDKNALINVG